MFLKRDTTTEQDKTDYQAGIVKLSNSNEKVTLIIFIIIRFIAIY